MTLSINQNTPLLTLDGSHGEGGGQILRTALGLSALTGRPFAIEKIRAKRPKPGLMRQHLTCVNAAAEICGATVVGAAIGSTAVTFTPRTVKPGDYRFAIGSAGSTTLVLQTVLPALMLADGPSTITLEGGTHNMHAPPVDFLRDAFVAVVNRMGPRLEISLERYGFYPAGGGRWRVTITPAKALTPLSITERGETIARTATALVAALPGEIAKRELAQVEKMLGWTGAELVIRQLPQDEGPGNVLMLKIQSQHITDLFTAFGQRGLSAENVAHSAVTEARTYLASSAPVGEHLADQLLIPFSLAGSGNFVATCASTHLTTNIAVIEKFLNVRWTVTNVDGGVKCDVTSTAS